MLKIGVLGYGYWGPNIVRNFNSIKEAKISSVCDINSIALNRVKKAYPNLKVFKDYRNIVAAKDIDVVAIVTPASTHFQLAKIALRNGKHIFVEKPFTLKSSEAEELIALADKNKLKIIENFYIK